MPTIKNQQILPVLWDALIEAGYKVHLDAPDCEFIYVAYPSQLSSLVLRTEFSYSVSVRSCVKLAQNPLLNTTITTLAKTLLRDFYNTRDTYYDIHTTTLLATIKELLGD